jgi:hypothetical protein
MYKPRAASPSTLDRPVAIDGDALAATSGGAPPVGRTPSNGSGASFHTAQTHQSSRPPSPAPAPAQPAAPGPTVMQRLHDAGITNGRVGAFVAGLSLAGGLAVGIPALTKGDGGDEKQ